MWTHFRDATLIVRELGSLFRFGAEKDHRIHSKLQLLLLFRSPCNHHRVGNGCPPPETEEKCLFFFSADSTLSERPLWHERSGSLQRLYIIWIIDPTILRLFTDTRSQSFSIGLVVRRPGPQEYPFRCFVEQLNHLPGPSLVSRLPVRWMDGWMDGRPVPHEEQTRS